MPGKKAIVINPTKPAFETMLVTCRADIADTERKINKIISDLPKHLTYLQVSQVFGQHLGVAHTNYKRNIEVSQNIFQILYSREFKEISYE